MSLRDLLVSQMTTPETKKAFTAILDLRDVLADSGVDHIRFMALLEPLSQLCGAYEAVKFTLDTYKTTEKERFVSVPKATEWIGKEHRDREKSKKYNFPNGPVCHMHEETASEHIKNVLTIVYSMRTPMDAQGNVTVARTDLDAIVERLYKALSHLEPASSPVEPQGFNDIPPESQMEDAGNGNYEQFDGYRDFKETGEDVGYFEIDYKEGNERKDGAF
jgi:hypothetical protein